MAGVKNSVRIAGVRTSVRIAGVADLSQDSRCADLSQDSRCADFSQDCRCADLSQDSRCADLSQNSRCAHLSQDSRCAHLSQDSRCADRDANRAPPVQSCHRYRNLVSYVTSFFTNNCTSTNVKLQSDPSDMKTVINISIWLPFELCVSGTFLHFKWLFTCLSDGKSNLKTDIMRYLLPSGDDIIKNI
jgi:hypothetical protein